MKSATLTSAMVREFSEKHGVTMGYAKRMLVHQGIQEELSEARTVSDLKPVLEYILKILQS